MVYYTGQLGPTSVYSRSDTSSECETATTLYVTFSACTCPVSFPIPDQPSPPVELLERAQALFGWLGPTKQNKPATRTGRRPFVLSVSGFV
jgi:hypothetical protein